MALEGPTASLTASALAAASSGLPGSVRRVAAERFAATLQACVRGATSPDLDLLAGYAVTFGGEGTVPVPGRDEQLDPLSAIQVTGSAAAFGGPTAPAATAEAMMLAVASGVGYDRDARTADVLTAFAVGCEVAARLSAALPSGPARAWNNVITSGVMGASVTAGLLLASNQHQLRVGLGIAASQLVGHRETDGIPTEGYLAGKAAVNGAHAAMLAADGITASSVVLEHPRGFFAVLDRDRASGAATAVEGIGDRWQWLEGRFGEPADGRGDPGAASALASAAARETVAMTGTGPFRPVLKAASSESASA